MSDYDLERPFMSQDVMPLFLANDSDEAQRYGRTVRATRLSNVEYKLRFGRLGEANNMKPPPSSERIFDGYLVVRRLGRPDQYETWMPDHAFDEAYAEQPPNDR